MGEEKRIDSHIRERWLRWSEQGDSPTKIADKDDYDVRTVRKHLKIAVQERERKEARSHVLREALREHYDELLQSTVDLDNYLVQVPRLIYDLSDAELMWSALKEHLPRSPIWRNLKQWEEAKKQLVSKKGDAAAKLVSWLEQNGVSAKYQDKPADELRTYFDRMYDSWIHQDSIRPEEITVEERNDRLVFKYGSFSMFDVPKEQEATVRASMGQIHVQAGVLPEFPELRDLRARMDDLAAKIRKETKMIRLKKVLTGNCQLCPI